MAITLVTINLKCIIKISLVQDYLGERKGFSRMLMQKNICEAKCKSNGS
jgi:hypothetical protein